MRLWKVAVAAAIMSVVGPVGVASSQAATIAVIGTGMVGSTLGKRWAALGNEIVYGSREPNSEKVKALVKETPRSSAKSTRDAVAKASIILFAVPGSAIQEAVAGLGPVDHKIIIDTTNMMVVKDRMAFPGGGETSLAEQIQALAPGASVVKAFNTMSAATMANPAASGGPVTLPIAGNDAAAKAEVTKLGQGMGLAVLDYGDLRTARLLEDLARVYVTYNIMHRPKMIELQLRPVG